MKRANVKTACPYVSGGSVSSRHVSKAWLFGASLQTVEMLVHMFSEAGPEPSTGVPVDCIYTNAPEACHRSLRRTERSLATGRPPLLAARLEHVLGRASPSPGSLANWPPRGPLVGRRVAPHSAHPQSPSQAWPGQGMGIVRLPCVIPGQP